MSSRGKYQLLAVHIDAERLSRIFEKGSTPIGGKLSNLLRRWERGEMAGDELRHQHRLMIELERIATEERLPVVDNIRIVDQDRRRLASWAHLTGDGNLRLAEA